MYSYVYKYINFNCNVEQITTSSTLILKILNTKKLNTKKDLAM